MKNCINYLLTFFSFLYIFFSFTCNLKYLEIPDEVDIKLPGGEQSYIKHSNVSAVEEFSLSIWLRYLGQSKGTFLTLANEGNRNSRFVTVNEEVLTIHGSTAEATSTISLNKQINDGHWHHLFVAMSSKTSIAMVVLDTVVLPEVVLKVNQMFFNPTGLIVVGKDINATGWLSESGFIGEISQLGIWNRVFNSTEIRKLVSNCTVDLSGTLFLNLFKLHQSVCSVS